MKKLLILFILVAVMLTSLVAMNLERTINDYNFKGIVDLNIINFSDLHYGYDISDQTVNDIVREMNALKPDLIMFTGDLIDNYGDVYKFENGLEPLIEALSTLEARYGKYAVFGNHDYFDKTYISEDTFRYILEASGFTVLINESQDIVIDEQIVRIYGLDNLSYGSPTYKYGESDYEILLLHEPDGILSFDHNADLMLAGHSHGGQIRLPIIGSLITPPGARTFIKGVYDNKGGKMIVSTGLGVTHIKYRFFNPPSFDHIEIRNE